MSEDGSLFNLAMAGLFHMSIEFDAIATLTKRSCRANTDDDSCHGR